MLQAIRDRATGWIAYGIVGLLVIPFAFWGIDQYQGGGTIVVAEVEGGEITLPEFQSAFQEQQAQMQTLFGERFDPALLNEDRLKQDVLRQLVDRRLVDEVARSAGYRASDAQVASSVYAVPAFQTDGRFDPERYRNLVAREGMSVEGFEERVRADLTADQLRGGLVASYVPTKAEVDAVLRLQEQQRAIGYLRLPLSQYQEAVEASDEDVTAWYESNRERFVSDERVKLQYLALTVEALAEEVSLPGGAIEAAYEERKARFTREETREASHVLVRLDLEADDALVARARTRIETILDRVRGGELSFDEAMELAAVDGETELEAGELGEVSPGMLGPAFEDALFAIESEGTISDPVRSDFGFHLIRLDAINPERIKTFEEVAPELELALKKEEADNLFYERAEELANLAYEAPGSLEPAAEALGLEVQESDWLTRTGGEGLLGDPKVVEAAFGGEVLADGVNSPVIEVSPTELMVIRLLEHEPSEPLSLEDVKQVATEGFKRERALQIIAERTETLLPQAEAGGDLAELASAEGAEWNSPVAMGRSGGSVDPTIVREAFMLPRPPEGSAEFASVELAGGDRALVVVTAVTDGAPESANEETREEVLALLRRQGGSAEFDAVMRALRASADIRLFPDRL
jgi:peptidyl-prolyl cis-trans isomerase D